MRSIAPVILFENAGVGRSSGAAAPGSDFVAGGYRRSSPSCLAAWKHWRQSLANETKALRYYAVRGQLLHGRQRSDVKRVVDTLDAPKRQACDVDQPARGDHGVLQQQVEMRRAARQNDAVRSAPTSRPRLRRPLRERTRTSSSGAPRRRDLVDRSDNVGIGAHRQRLPLMYSRICASEPARPSSRSATADKICPAVQ